MTRRTSTLALIRSTLGPVKTITLFAFAVSCLAQASVNEPNALVVPIDSNNNEVQLYTLFTSRSETFDWKADAHTVPNQFSPLCGFTAKYVLNESAVRRGLAWYNDTGSAPAAGDLHTIVSSGSAVGTTITGATIKGDPAYTGGLVGFALIGGSEIHYSNPAYDNVCTNCSPPAPWITSLTYASTVTQNAFYVCFEDGATNATSWANDGDFNDDVYFVTGVTCAGGGQPCATPLKGICSAGLTQCTESGTTCKQVTQPATETCNGFDDDCDGTVDNGATCSGSQVCFQGRCVNACGGEFGCTDGKVCQGQFCVDADCVGVTCDEGKVCTAGSCHGPCEGVVCPGLEVCRVGRCVDPCDGVTCASGQVCTGGACVTGCDCQGCASGKACDPVSKQCVVASCLSVSCDAGSFCSAGACVDDCANAVCPSGQACQAGSCIAVPDAGGSSRVDAGMVHLSDGGTGGGSGGGTGSDGDGGVRGDGGSKPGTISVSSGCGCNSVDSGLVLFAAVALVLSRRRR